MKYEETSHGSLGPFFLYQIFIRHTVARIKRKEHTVYNRDREIKRKPPKQIMSSFPVKLITKKQE